MIKLSAQLGLVDFVGKPDGCCAIDERKSCIDLRIKSPNHLQHKQLVKVCIQKAAHNWIKLPSVVVHASRNISPGHNGLQSKNNCSASFRRNYKKGGLWPAFLKGS